jgi:hypothetical protein
LALFKPKIAGKKVAFSAGSSAEKTPGNANIKRNCYMAVLA